MIKSQKHISFVNNCGAIYDEDVLQDSILWYAEKFVERVKTIYLYGRYPAVSIGKFKIHIHRLIGLFLLQNKTSKLHIHHKNGNKLDCRVENLDFLSAREHLSHHNKGHKPSIAAIRATIASNHLRKGKRAKPKRPDITPKQIYDMRLSGKSFNQISKEINMDLGCVKQRYDDFIHDNPELITR